MDNVACDRIEQPDKNLFVFVMSSSAITRPFSNEMAWRSSKYINKQMIPKDKNTLVYHLRSLINDYFITFALC